MPDRVGWLSLCWLGGYNPTARMRISDEARESTQAREHCQCFLCLPAPRSSKENYPVSLITAIRPHVLWNVKHFMLNSL